MAWISGNYYLSESEKRNNAVMVASYFMAKGWSINAVSGVLGNMESESTINPGVWQSLIVGSGGGGGFGLVQWTPWTNFTDWADTNGYAWSDGNAQCKWIDEMSGVLGQWIPTTNYPLNWNDFKISTLSPEHLASAFLKNFERAGVEVEETRRTQARKWYNYLLNSDLSPYTPRLTEDGITGNPWYYDKNPFYQSGFGLPNCTCYAWGRWGELLGEAPTLSLGNADTWIDRNTTYEVGQTPKLGAIAVWSYDGRDGGHVAVVEQINSDGSIVTSNSAWGGTFFYTQVLKESEGYEWASYTNFQGFIYFPKEFGFLPDITKKKKKKKFKWVLFNKNRSVRT